MRALGRLATVKLRRLSRQGLFLLATIPFWLVSNSSQVWTRVKIERDGGALRQIAATVHPELRRELPTWVSKVIAGAAWDGTWEERTDSAYTYLRDFRTNNANYGEDGRLAVVDVLQNPLSLYTTYTWTEKVNFSYLYETDKTAAEATKLQVKYVVNMPGRVMEASAQPAGGSSVETEGGNANFALSAAEPSISLTVTSAKIRWGYLLVIIYALGWIALEIFRLLGKLARLRPRKI